MATTVYTVEEYALEDGTTITLKPANIKVMRKGQELIGTLSDAEDNDDGINKLLDIVCLCLKRQRPDFEHEVEVDGVKKTVPNYDLLEELFDLDTVFKVIEVYLGVKLNDPKLLEAAAKAAVLNEQAEALSSMS
jgi:hypothetical protein